jgi:VanZ family protein
MLARRPNAVLGRILGQGTAVRVAAWLCITAVGALSLLPSEQVTRSTLGGHAEHILAYAMTAFVTAAAYAGRNLVWVGVTLLAYAQILEYLQRFSPGRNARLEDLAFSGVGILIGVVVLAFIARTRRGGGDPRPMK